VSVKDRNGGKTASFKLEMTVMSDHLHVSSGKSQFEQVTAINDSDVEMFLKTGSLPKEAHAAREFVKFMQTTQGLAIPGGTVKGLVRSRLELLVDCACYTFLATKPSRTVSRVYQSIFHPQRKFSERFEDNSEMCFVCDLMGNMGLASRVSFTDLTFQDGKVNLVPMTGSTYETVEKGSKFLGSFTVRNYDDADVGAILFALGIGRGNGIVLMGRFKFTDKSWGRVKFNVPNVDAGKYVKAFLEAHKGHVRVVEER
jgi:CRISPR/Cas system CSM-associated protein Csm3 (group 7 of RAMP superfamily)